MRRPFLQLFIAVTLMLFTKNTLGQILWVEIGVNGLTCSQCTRTVEMSIRKLDFIKDVHMDLEKTSGNISFKPGMHVNIEKIADAVTNAGFSVRYLDAGIVFDHVDIRNGYCYPLDGNFYQFTETDTAKLNGETRVKFLGKKYLPAKEYRKLKSEFVSKCSKPEQQDYFITL
jgi:copper chaperone CopZ